MRVVVWGRGISESHRQPQVGVGNVSVFEWLQIEHRQRVALVDSPRSILIGKSLRCLPVAVNTLENSLTEFPQLNRGQKALAGTCLPSRQSARYLDVVVPQIKMGQGTSAHEGLMMHHGQHHIFGMVPRKRFAPLQILEFSGMI